MPVIRYVNHAASGANDGTTETDAWTSFASAYSLGPGDEVRVSHTHVQRNLGGVQNVSTATRENPLRIISYDFSTNTPTPGAIIGTSNSAYIEINWCGNFYAYGISWEVSYIGRLNALGGCWQEHRECRLVSTYDIFGQWKIDEEGYISGITRLIDCELAYEGTAFTTGLWVNGGENIYIRNLQHSGHTPTSALLQCWTGYIGLTDIVVENSDLSMWPRLVNAAGTTAHVKIVFRHCHVADVFDIHSGPPVSPYLRVTLENCSDTTLSAPALGMSFCSQLFGTLTPTISVYRTGGAHDGHQANEYSIQMVSDANTLPCQVIQSLHLQELSDFVEPGSQTVAIYFASAETLETDELWVDLYSPSEDSGSETSIMRFQSTKIEQWDVPTAHATHSSSGWQGSYGGSAQKIEFSINPTIAGPVIVRVFLARPTTTVYVDPMLGIT